MVVPYDVLDAVNSVAAMGGLGGIAALVSAIAALKTSKDAQASADKATLTNEAVAAQLRPDHGTSLRDAVDDANKKIDLLAEEVTLLARTMDSTNKLVRDRLKGHDREIAEIRKNCDD